MVSEQMTQDMPCNPKNSTERGNSKSENTYLIPEILDWMADEDYRKHTSKPPKQYDESNDVQDGVEAFRREDPAVKKEHRYLGKAHGRWKHELNGKVGFLKGDCIFEAERYQMLP